MTSFPSLTNRRGRAAITLLSSGVLVALLGATLFPTRSSRASAGASPSPSTVVNVLAKTETFVSVPPVAPAATPTPTVPPSVSITKSDGRESVRTGDTLTYRIRVRNPLNEDRTQVKIVDHVPAFLIPLTVSPEATADPKTRTVTWTNQTISALAEVTFAFTARVDPATPNGLVLENVVDMNGPGVSGSTLDRTLVVGAATPAPPRPPPPAEAPRLQGPKPPVTVSAPRPVPVAAQTGMDLPSVLLTVGSALAGAGGFLLRRTR